MPRPGALANHPNYPAAALESLLKRAQEPASLSDEVRALREEIAALREELAPVPGLILTGREVVREFQRLRCGIQASEA